MEGESRKREVVSNPATGDQDQNPPCSSCLLVRIRRGGRGGKVKG